MAELGLTYNLVGDAEWRFAQLKRFVDERFTCDSPWFENNTPYRFQHVGMNMAYYLDRVLIDWTTGTGKTVLATLVAKRLFDEGRIDRLIVFCDRHKRTDWGEFLSRNALLDVEKIDGVRKARHDRYRRSQADAWILNYAKARAPSRTKKGVSWERTDLALLLDAASDRTLVVLDEAELINNVESLTHQGIAWMLERGPRAIAMTATPYTRDAKNYWNIFEALAPGFLGTEFEFDAEYVKHKYMTSYGRVKYKFHRERLPLLGKRISPRTHVVSKSDPEIARQFPETVEREIYIDLSEDDKALYDFISGRAQEEFDDNDYVSNEANFQLLRMVCNSASSLRYSSSRIAKDIVASNRFELSPSSSEKFKTAAWLLSVFAESGESAMVFSFWANAVIPDFKACLETNPMLQVGFRDYKERGREGAQYEVDLEVLVGKTKEMKTTEQGGRGESKPGAVKFLLASDVGKRGLNIYVPNLIHLETPYLYSDYFQRTSRISRIDSKSKGISRVWVYRFLTRDTVEERVDEMVWRRKRESEMISGAKDVTPQEHLGTEDLRRLMFGGSR